MTESDRMYEAIARSLRDFGYGTTSAAMIRETDEARKRGEPKDQPHGIISMFANGQLDEWYGRNPN